MTKAKQKPIDRYLKADEVSEVLSISVNSVAGEGQPKDETHGS